MQIRTIKADPSGNITLFLLDPVAPEIRKALNQELLSLDPSVEQCIIQIFHYISSPSTKPKSLLNFNISTFIVRKKEKSTIILILRK